MIHSSAMRRGLARCSRGATAIIVAVLAPMLCLVGGFAVDYAYASYINQRLSEAADAATLAAVSASSANMAGGYANTAVLQTYGQQVLNANLASLNLQGVTANLQVVAGSGTNSHGATATTTISYPSPAFFSKILGSASLGTGATVSATAAPTTYVTYYILIDNSQSMGIGQDTSAMQALFSLTGCGFGCHYRDNPSYETIAHNHNISLRIDAARQAVQNVITSAQANAGVLGNISIGIYLMDNPEVQSFKTNPTITTLTSPTNDYPTLLNTYVPKIDLGNYSACTCADTDFADQMALFNKIVPAQGDGLSPSSPLNYVMIITDGMDDVECNSGPNRDPSNSKCGAAFDPKLCNTIKKNATVGTVYTTYNSVLGFGDDTQYNEVAANVVNSGQIWPNLQACASDASLAFQASDGADLQNAMNSLFASTLKMARLTN